MAKHKTGLALRIEILPLHFVQGQNDKVGRRIVKGTDKVGNCG
jgi:hypothetical protein